jgi:AAA domain
MASRKKSAASPDEGQLGLSALPEKKRKLLTVQVRDFKGVEFCQIDFKKAVTIVGGKNGSGKSSTLDGISALLGGAGQLPTDPIRDGAESARLWADLGDLTVERLIDPELGSDGTTLALFDEELNPVPKPQTELARMYNALSFDPMGFGALPRDKQNAVLMRLGKIDLSGLQARRAAAYDERTGVNKDVRDLEAQFRERKHDPAAPEQELDVGELTQQIAQHDAWEAERTRVANAEREAQRAIAAATDAVMRAENALAQAELVLASAKKSLEAEQLGRAPAIAALADFRAAPEPPRAELLEKIRLSGETNRAVRENAERRKIGAKLQERKAHEEQLSRTIEACDREKEETLAAVEWPIQGLGFDEYGPTYKGHPIAQAAASERWRIGATIALALNPALPVLLIRHGNDMDEDTLAEMTAWAEEKGAQLVIEMVTRRPEDERDVDVMMKNGVGVQNG